MLLSVTYHTRGSLFISEIFPNTDKGLISGIVGIGYEINNVVSSNKGKHALSLVGKKCINGQEHYILRNSWGVQACEAEKKKMTLENLKSTTKALTQNENIKDHSTCMKKCNEISTVVETLAYSYTDPKKVLEKEECNNGCYVASKDKLEKEIEAYQCDEKGYYFIKNEKILKSISTVQYMQGR